MKLLSKTQFEASNKIKWVSKRDFGTSTNRIYIYAKHPLLPHQEVIEVLFWSCFYRHS